MKQIIFLLCYVFLSVSLTAQTQIKEISTGVNFRSSPAIENNIICSIPAGTQVSVDYSNQTNKDWVQFNYNGHTGYVYSTYLVNPNQNGNTSSSNQVKYYKNSKGNTVQSPTHYDRQPSGATALCRDGTYSFSQSRRGTCSGHGGVSRWLD